MGKVNVQPLPKEVERLKAQVQDWRRAKANPKFPMPSEPWDVAVHLAKRFGVCRIARAVGLDYGCLRKRVEQAPAQTEDVTPTFLELPLGMVVAVEAQGRGQSGDPGSVHGQESGLVIDLYSPEGARMRIRSEAGMNLDAAGIVAAFLGRRP
jgi:hypothetical protein